MSKLQTRTFLGLLAAGVCAVVTLAIANGQASRQRPAEALLPAGTVAYFAHDGSAKHKEAWEKTAAYQALYESGMMDFVQQVFAFAAQQSGQTRSPQIDATVKHIDEHGMSVSVSVPEQGPPLPRVTVVLHDAAAVEANLTEIVTRHLGPFGLRFETREIQGRSIRTAVVPQSPGVEVSYWVEGQHVIVLAGIGAVADAVAVANGDAPSIATNSVWEKYRFEAAGSEATSVAWIDIGTLRNKYGAMRLPPPANGTVNDGMQALGFQNLGAVAWQYGYKDRAMWTEGHVEVVGERTGLLSITDQEPFRLEDLPPLPKNVSAFSATRIDHAKLWPTLTAVARNVATLGPSGGPEDVDRMLNQVEQMIGFDPKTELLDHLGDIVCIYADPDQGFLGSGTGVAIKVKDADKLRAAVDKLMTLATNISRGDFAARRTNKHGREIVLFQAAKQAHIGALMIDDDWMVMSLMPQSLEAFALRADGRLESWKPTDHQVAALAELPSEFNSISIGDPRVAWQSMIKLAPAAMVAAEIAIKEQGLIPRDTMIPVTPADIPPAELVVNPLFPNVSVSVVDENGVHITSRRSLPGVPFVSEGGSATTVAVGVALLLPAIQSAREAARRTQSANNLKQLALSLHNYHDVYGSLPAGSYPNEKLKPDERFSWLSRVLPFVEQSPLYNELDFEEAWDDDENKQLVETRVRTFLNPGYPSNGNGVAPTHYVGMAGVGKDAPGLGVKHPRAGIFGDNRKTRFRDITDGTSNTIMISEASDKFGAWAQGGRSTYRPLTKKPYINGPDGIGGPFRGGCNTAFGDGSVRFISENVDPAVLEALSTMAGREVVPNF